MRDSLTDRPLNPPAFAASSGRGPGVVAAVRAAAGAAASAAARISPGGGEQRERNDGEEGPDGGDPGVLCQDEDPGGEARGGRDELSIDLAGVDTAEAQDIPEWIGAAVEGVIGGAARNVEVIV